MNASVIICTHNPRAHYLKRVLEGLQGQSCALAKWELLVVDNASEVPLDQTLDLSWHPRARVLREPQLGLTPCRLRGVRDSVGDILIFVDDDNVLDARYIETALNLGETHPFLGAWGAGILRPSFDTPPPGWAIPYIRYLTVGERDCATWANLREPGMHVPAGAGICIRRTVALRYLALAEHSEFRMGLDRRGSSLVSGGDVDMALTSCDMGLGTGVFPELGLTHLIPESRLEKAYLLRLVEEMVWSAGALAHLRGKYEPGSKRFLYHLVRNTFNRLKLRGIEREFYVAEWRGEQRARRDFGKPAAPSLPLGAPSEPLLS